MHGARGEFWWGNLRERDRFGKPAADTGTRFILKETVGGGGGGGRGLYSSGSVKGQVVASCAHGDEPPGS
jgi:hypothetical protein